VAILVNELQRLGAEEQRELFLKRYAISAKDREMNLMLPAYQTLQAMRSGLTYSETLTEGGLEEPRRSELIELAQSYFELAVQTSREIPR
jgi:aminoglycoside phosphotransferase family enzyme